MLGILLWGAYIEVAQIGFSLQVRTYCCLLSGEAVHGLPSVVLATLNVSKVVRAPITSCDVRDPLPPLYGPEPGGGSSFFFPPEGMRNVKSRESPLRVQT